MLRDFKSNYGVAFLTNIASQTDNTALTAKLTRANANNVDCIALLLGSVADADVAFTAVLEESDNDSSYTAVNARDYSGTLTGIDFADDNTVHIFNYWGNKKYVRLTVTPANNTGNITWGALSITGVGRIQP